MMEESPNSYMPNNSTTFNSSRAKPAKNLLQSLEIEKICLDFLHKCKYRKRPPQSLRVNGCNGLPFSQKILLISKIEKEILLQAIKNKNEEIERLEDRYANHRYKNTMTGLSNTQRTLWKRKYNKKIVFYKKQETEKWRFWPDKTKKLKKTEVLQQERKKN